MDSNQHDSMLCSSLKILLHHIHGNVTDRCFPAAPVCVESLRVTVVTTVKMFLEG